MVIATALPRLPVTPSLHRTVFTTSRMMEYFTERELEMQLGVGRWQWPVALLKELVDNALDACESAAVPPQISITVAPDALTVSDNGPGLPYATLTRSLDYLVRVSDKAYYVSPTRGQLGNALKGVWTAPFIADGTEGRIDVQTAAYACQVCVRLDRIAQKPVVTLEPLGEAIVQNGTSITLHWPGIASEIEEQTSSVLYNGEIGYALPDLLLAYAAFNPHATFILVTPSTSLRFPSAAHAWTKWAPDAPMSPQWYTAEQFRDLLAAYLTSDRATGTTRYVREVVAQFQGLKRSAAVAEVTQQAGLHGATLDALVDENGLCLQTVGRLLRAMQARSRPIHPKALGVMGEAHLRRVLTQHLGAGAETVTYKALLGTSEGLPYVVEAACGWSTTTVAPGRCMTGINWTPGLRAPFPTWRYLLGECRVDTHDQVSLLVHLACPYVAVTDRAKSAVDLPSEIMTALATAVRSATKGWQRLKASGDKNNRVTAKAIEDEAKRQRRQQISIKDAAWGVMGEAYLKASDNGRFPANARQIMYAARPLVIALRDPAPIWKNDSQFTQGYLPDFLAAYPDLTRDWDVVYDDRGHFAEPHTEATLGLGTLKVRRYLRSWAVPSFATPAGWQFALDRIDTFGPGCRYQYVLFLEKEGFDELLAVGHIAARYDVAIMSTKGQTVTAARTLIEALGRKGVTVLVAHDFDKAGIEILDKFSSDTRRFTYATQTKIIDLGLRLPDVEAMGLERERVDYGDDKDPRRNLRSCGATEAEVDFLVSHQDYGGEWHGARVELNAMTSPQFLAWLEAKFAEIGLKKVVPDEETLARAYKTLARNALLQRQIDKFTESLPDAETLTVPDGLAEVIRTRIAGTPQSWDGALWKLAVEAQDEATHNARDGHDV